MALGRTYPNSSYGIKGESNKKEEKTTKNEWSQLGSNLTIKPPQLYNLPYKVTTSKTKSIYNANTKIYMPWTICQSYKSRTAYCTVFSLQRYIPDLRIGIPGSYRFEFQKIKKLKYKNLKFYSNSRISGGIWTKIPVPFGIWRYRPVFDRYNLGY